MSIINSIKNSKSNLIKPNNKSYWGYVLNVRLVNVKQIQEKESPYPTEERTLLHEFSGKEPVKNFIVLSNDNKKLGRLTTSQVKEMFDDMGFNVDPTFSGKHFADFEAVMNVGGYSIPGWVKMARIISKSFPSHEKTLLRKLSPGKDRLHLRFFESNDGTWLIAGHTDYNWLNLNLSRVYKAHISSGTGIGSGDYITGTIMVYLLLKEFAIKIKQNKIFTERGIQKILKKAYNQSLVEKLRYNHP